MSRGAHAVGRWLCGILGLVVVASSHAEGPQPVRLELEPPAVTLAGPRHSAQVLATATFPDGRIRDVTQEVAWSEQGATIEVAAPGRVEPVADGSGVLVARLGSLEARADIRVTDLGHPAPVAFRHEVLPALTKAGCNQGACHGTPTGKAGFRLSLRGYDPTLDLRTLTREVGDRRTNPFDPGTSLLLRKGLGTTPHEGGKRFTSESPSYQLLHAWIAGGLKSDAEGVPALERLEVRPASRVLDAPAEGQQLAVRAYFRDGTSRDVTRLARYSSSDLAIATSDEEGRITRRKRGEVAVLVSFENLIATSTLVFRDEVPGLAWTNPPESNFIDHHVFAKLKLLRIPPSDLCDDATFCRRVYLDVMGVPPTPAEALAFLADAHPDKRARLIDALLERPEYADFWALKWADRLGCNQRFTGLKGAYSYHRWIHAQIAANVPFDRFARAIVTAKGPNYSHPPASFYRRVRNPEDAVETVSQLFLGTRLQCAKCHNHVSERWTQDDYYGMAAFFSQVRYKNGPNFQAIYDKEETIFLEPGAQTRQPRTGQVMAPKPLGGDSREIPAGEDRREALADWLIAPGNPFFAKAAVNRIWYHLMGRGIVDPVDDLRESNPPASAELLQALADDFVSRGYDVKQTIRTILRSRTYQLSAQPNAFNADDARYFSHATVRLLSAEQLLDAASQATGVTEKLFHLPPGTRAAQVPDGEFAHPFLRTFGQPLRSEACECERQSDSTLEQALQVIGGRTIHAKLLAPDNRIGKLIDSGAGDSVLVEELFLATLGRRPDTSELALATARLAADPARRRTAAEDLLWSLLNHPEFLFQH